MGCGICFNVYEKYCIKWVDWLLFNGYFQCEVLFIYVMICWLFCICKYFVIVVDWLDLDKCKKYFLFCVVIVVKGWFIIFYQEVYDRKVSVKVIIYRDFLEILYMFLLDICQFIIVIDVGYKLLWFCEVQVLRWYIVGCV